MTNPFLPSMRPSTSPSGNQDDYSPSNPNRPDLIRDYPAFLDSSVPLFKLMSVSVCSLMFISACSDSSPSDPTNEVVSDVVATDGVSTDAIDAVEPVEVDAQVEGLSESENPVVPEAMAPQPESNVDEVVADTASTPDTDTSVENAVAESPVVDTDTPSAAITPEFEARYTLTFEALWSAETHPTNFPGDPHFSGLVGAVHNEQVVLWEPGQIASGGVEVVAESGAKTSFLDEINSVIADGRALSAIDGGGVATSPGEQSIEFEVNRDYPLVTVLTMLAPSPDWILGVHGLNMLSGDDFVDSMTVDLSLYDAGTDSGLSFESGNEDTQPRSTIQFVTSDPADSDFIEGLPLAGRFRIEKQ